MKFRKEKPDQKTTVDKVVKEKDVKEAKVSKEDQARAKKAEEEKRAKTAIPVKATQLGYYDHARRRPGDEFVIHAEEDFSEKWMEKVDAQELKEQKEAEEEKTDTTDEEKFEKAGLVAEKKEPTEVL